MRVPQAERPAGAVDTERVYTVEMRMQPQKFKRPRRSVIFTCEQFELQGIKPGQFIGYDPLIDQPHGQYLWPCFPCLCNLPSHRNVVVYTQFER